jgi:hypothetical protein
MRAAQTMTRDMPGNEGRSGPSTSARVSLDMGRGGWLLWILMSTIAS